MGRYLGGLNVVMEVIPEDLDVGDVFVAALRSQVTGEENCILLGLATVGQKPGVLPKVT